MGTVQPHSSSNTAGAVLDFTPSRRKWAIAFDLGSNTRTSLTPWARQEVRPGLRGRWSGAIKGFGFSLTIDIWSLGKASYCMRTRYLGLLAVAAISFGCHKGDPYVGTWKATDTIAGANLEITRTNFADGTFKSHLRGSREDSKVVLLVDDVGTWKKLSDTSVDERLVDTKWVTEGGSAKVRASSAARFARNKDHIIAEANKEPIMKLKWVGNDQFTASDSRESITFHRSP